MKTIKFITRIISLPFLFIFVFIAKLRDTFLLSGYWLWYGGETWSYQKDFNPENIRDLLGEFQQNNARRKGSELIFISQIDRDGLKTSKIDPKYLDRLNVEMFTIRPLSLTKETFIASGFNSFVVKIK